MSRESKIMTAIEWETQETISHYEAFGWELLSINGKQITMSRETQNPVYTDLVKYQAMYEECLEKYRKVPKPEKPIAPPPYSIGTGFITFILAVVPFVIYTAYKVNQRNKYKEAMLEYEKQYQEYKDKRAALVEEMKSIVLQSRTVFFSKQN